MLLLWDQGCGHVLVCPLFRENEREQDLVHEMVPPCDIVTTMPVERFSFGGEWLLSCAGPGGAAPEQLINSQCAEFARKETTLEGVAAAPMFVQPDVQPHMGELAGASSIDMGAPNNKYTRALELETLSAASDRCSSTQLVLAHCFIAPHAPIAARD